MHGQAVGIKMVDPTSSSDGEKAANRSAADSSAQEQKKQEKKKTERAAARKRDDLLVKRTLAGDRSAFQELFEIYRPKVQSLAYQILKSQEDSEDVVQESFVKAYLALPKYRGQAAFYTWLFRIVYNMAIDYKRRIARRGGEPLELKEESLNSSEVSSSYEAAMGRIDDPHKQVERRQELAQAQRALGRLSDEHRSVITLREIDGLSYDEIADVMGVTKGTVMSRLHYARKALHSALAKEEG